MPPTQIGGPGRCTGVGSTVMPSTSPSVNARRRYASAASVSRPRAAKSAPIAANSSGIQPVPTPRMTRPFDSASMLATSLATTSGCRYGRTVTPKPSRTRSVRPATAARTAKGSRSEMSDGRSPASSPYGYGVVGVPRQCEVVAGPHRVEAEPLGLLGDPVHEPRMLGGVDRAADRRARGSRVRHRASSHLRRAQSSCTMWNSGGSARIASKSARRCA